MSSKVIKSHQMYEEASNVIKEHRKTTGVIKRHQKSSRVIESHQKSSKGHQKSSAVKFHYSQFFHAMSDI
jgi:hypothetical protein